jgi:hypothetical protein
MNQQLPPPAEVPPIRPPAVGPSDWDEILRWRLEALEARLNLVEIAIGRQPPPVEPPREATPIRSEPRPEAVGCV